MVKMIPFRSLVRWLMITPIALFGLSGCGPPSKGNAPGAATVDELLQVYLQAHQNQNVTMLHDVLLWHGPIGGVIRGWQERERQLDRLFQLQLKQVILVELEWRPPDLPHEGTEHYVRVRPDPRFPYQKAVLPGGVFLGKIVLRGTATDPSGQSAELEIDGAMFIRPFEDRYYLYTEPPVMEDAVEAVEAALPQALIPATPDHLDAESVHFAKLLPKRTPRVWWTVEDAEAVPAQFSGP